ncbi:unnamed protein product [Menidia menidia]|uniref:small monomeric GTPase n=1 Tax=Menidia menidia TaxID=238744 RepID=A0A8S4AVA5_9TELE|nr:unnamed protein product [Menidia menidia]
MSVYPGSGALSVGWLACSSLTSRSTKVAATVDLLAALWLSCLWTERSQQGRQGASCQPSHHHPLCENNHQWTVHNVLCSLSFSSYVYQAWLTEIHEYAQQDVVLMLLGNKAGHYLVMLSFGYVSLCLSHQADATHDRVVKREDGEKLAKEFGVPFMETSARSGLNVELAFLAVAKELKHRSMKDPTEKFKIQEYVNKEVKSAGCCRS